MLLSGQYIIVSHQLKLPQEGLSNEEINCIESHVFFYFPVYPEKHNMILTCFIWVFLVSLFAFADLNNSTWNLFLSIKKSSWQLCTFNIVQS